MESIMQGKKECYACGTTRGLESHHVIYGTANRKLSERYGLKVWLCRYHHTGSNQAVHFNKDFDLHLKKEAQKAFEKYHGSREHFVRIFGKNHL